MVISRCYTDVTCKHRMCEKCQRFITCKLWCALCTWKYLHFFTDENLFSPWPKISQSWWPGLELQHTAHWFWHFWFTQKCVEWRLILLLLYYYYHCSCVAICSWSIDLLVNLHTQKARKSAKNPLTAIKKFQKHNTQQKHIHRWLKIHRVKCITLGMCVYKQAVRTHTDLLQNVVTKPALHGFGLHLNNQRNRWGVSNRKCQIYWLMIGCG